MQGTELRRGQANSEGAAHDLPHALDLGPQGLIEPLHRPSLRAQHGVSELAHLREGGDATRRGLGVELRLVRRSLDLDVVLVNGVLV